ncbi:hypothetical protein ACFL2H_08935 [Planctomycetota bacterium]
MRESQDNPPENSLPPGIAETELTKSITTSGYPLQGSVAHLLRDTYQVIEEWSYIDRDTKMLRSLDVFADQVLADVGEHRPRIVLLIECKSSIHPYVFFQNAVENRIQFPTVRGLGRISIREESGRSDTTLYCDPHSILGLTDSEFGTKPAIASAFTKAIAKGKKVNVSGDDPFNSIVMPLVKANDHAGALFTPDFEADRSRPTLILRTVGTISGGHLGVAT